MNARFVLPLDNLWCARLSPALQSGIASDSELRGAINSVPYCHTSLRDVDDRRRRGYDVISTCSMNTNRRSFFVGIALYGESSSTRYSSCSAITSR